MTINVKRCYFHSIQPLVNYKVRQDRIKEIIARLDFMLEYGYLVPGCELQEILPEEYKENAMLPICGDDSVYLALHPRTELNLLGGSYLNGEFSAYFHHISGSSALVFDEHVTDNKRIKDRTHSLSEEVCIQDRVSLDNLVAVALPFYTPLSITKNFISYYDESNFAYTFDVEKSIMRDYVSKSKKIVENPKQEIERGYEIVNEFESCLEKYNRDIPCIRHDGTILDKNEEYKYIAENKKKVLTLIKKAEKLI